MKLPIILRNRHRHGDMGRDRRIMGAATYNFQSGNFRYPCQPLLNQIVIGANENSQSGLLGYHLNNQSRYRSSKLTTLCAPDCRANLRAQRARVVVSGSCNFKNAPTSVLTCSSFTPTSFHTTGTVSPLRSNTSRPAQCSGALRHRPEYRPQHSRKSASGFLNRGGRAATDINDRQSEFTTGCDDANSEINRRTAPVVAHDNRGDGLNLAGAESVGRFPIGGGVRTCAGGLMPNRSPGQRGDRCKMIVRADMRRRYESDRRQSGDQDR